MGLQIMTFYFDYLGMEKYAKECDKLLFVGGAMTFLLKQLAGQLCIPACMLWMYCFYKYGTTYVTLHRDR